jgi:steroid delta-isomerase-like uncharacterized protein
MAEDPKAVVQRLIDEVWNERNPAAVEALIAEDFIWHHTTLGELRGRASMLDVVEEMRAAFPDMRVTLDALAADGDKVMFYWVVTGTHTVPYRGAPPTGKQVTWTGMVLDRVVDGRIVERWTFADHRTAGSPHQLAMR